MKICFVLILSYFLGSIPFAYIITHLIVKKDIRKYGSGNVGATNASRVIGLGLGILVGALDMLKGFSAILIAQILLPSSVPSYFILLAGLMAIIGHNWSVFLKFSGGKGVAISFGVLLRLTPKLFLIYVIIWLLVAILTKYVSLASIVGISILPLFSFYLNGNISYTFFLLVLALFIIIRHYANIQRLLSGNEKKIKLSFEFKKGDF